VENARKKAEFITKETISNKKGDNFEEKLRKCLEILKDIEEGKKGEHEILQLLSESLK